MKWWFRRWMRREWDWLMRVRARRNRKLKQWRLVTQIQTSMGMLFLFLYRLVLQDCQSETV